MRRATNIGGFNTSMFNFYAGAFSNAYAGTFGVATNVYEGDQALLLTYTPGGQPVPEPATWAAAALLAGAATFVRWRRRKTA